MHTLPRLTAAALLATLIAAPACRHKPATAPPAQRVAMVFSASENDPWTAEILATVSAKLGFDPWSKSGSSGPLDAYGPYTAESDGRKVQVNIALCSLTGVGDLEQQRAIGQEVMRWLAQWSPDFAWLDGDQVQFLLGRSLGDVCPLIITGGVGSREAFFNSEQAVTGAYRRHSLPGALGQIWQRRHDAKRFALISDDSPVSLSRVHEFERYRNALPKGCSLDTIPPVRSWTELQRALSTLQADGAVVCGMGGPDCTPALRAQPCPRDLLTGAKVPIVVLGPSAMDGSGTIVVTLKPSAHAQAGLRCLEKLLSGVSAASIAIVSPDDMGVFIAEH